MQGNATSGVRGLGGLRTGIVAMVAIAALAGCAGGASGTRTDNAQRNCFSASSVTGFNALSDTRVLLHVGVRDVYELELLGFCPDVDWSQRIGVRSVGGSSWICTSDPLGVELVVPDHAGHRRVDRCRVRSMHKLSPEEASAARGRKEGTLQYRQQVDGG